MSSKKEIKKAKVVKAVKAKVAKVTKVTKVTKVVSKDNVLKAIDKSVLLAPKRVPTLDSAVRKALRAGKKMIVIVGSDAEAAKVYNGLKLAIRPMVFSDTANSIGAGEGGYCVIKVQHRVDEAFLATFDTVWSEVEN